jgi:hypothetical protein
LHLAQSLTLPSGFVDETVVSGLLTPRAFAFTPDGRILIAETGSDTNRTSTSLASESSKPACYWYRLLLHREPDEAGWQYWKEQIDQRRLSLKSLTTSFLTSAV